MAREEAMLEARPAPARKAPPERTPAARDSASPVLQFPPRPTAAATPRQQPDPTPPSREAPPPALVWLLLERLGAPVRRGVLLLLATAALAFGVVSEGVRPGTWRRTLRAEFRRTLRQAIAGGLGTVLIAAGLVGWGIVHQTLTWLSYAGQEGLTGNLLTAVLVREVTPVLVGLILLGRSGTVTVVEFGATKASGQLDVLEAQGLDPFALLVLPRVVALSLACFTLGVIFLGVALATGYMVSWLGGLSQVTPRELLVNLFGATDTAEFALFAVKLVLVGAVVALVCAITGMSSTRAETPSHLLPRGFVRGFLGILATSALLSVAAT
ncbi:ABC transporter permease [Falsiroseomonas sp. E2-1-a20]|uniref:MlaE family ABC transporter permease n=1 Tax=Falsiroseomonas sp. E2-1-a20 TaxID=3239300 RepID=UPI003F2AD240